MPKEKGSEKLHGMIQLIDRPKTADESAVTYTDDGLPGRIEVMKVGEWRYAFSEPVIIKATDLDMMVQNFKAGVRKGVAFDCDHDMQASTGWVTQLETGTDANGIYTLYADVEWTPMGSELLKGKIYKFFSPEWYTAYEDPETGQVYEQVLTGGALTNRPLMKKLAPLVASEDLTDDSDRFTIYREDVKNKSKRKASEMDLDAIRMKSPADCTAEELDLIKAHAGDLTSEELSRFNIEVPAADPDGDGDAGKDDDGDGDGESNTADDKTKKKNMPKENEVLIAKEQLALLEKKANDGAKALERLEAMEAEQTVKGFIASETNKDGKFAPAVADEMTAFYRGLTSKQADEFKAMVAKMPSLNLFSEQGSSEDITGGTETAIDVKAKELMASEKIEYAEAVSRVMASEPGLAKKLDEEVSAGK